MQNNNDSIVNLEAEKDLIACALFDFDLRDQILRNATSEDFQEPTFRKIFEELEKIKRDQLLGDHFLVAERLQKDNITLSYIENLLSQASYDIEVSDRLTIVRKYASARKSCNETQTYLNNIRENPLSIAEERDDHVKKQLELPLIIKSESKIIKTILQDYKENKSIEEHVKESMELRKQNKLPMKGHSWGYQSLDIPTSGIAKGHLVIIGARPGVGKTTFSLNVCLNLILKQIPCLFISLEMSDNALVAKLACNLANLSMKKVEEGLIYEDQYKKFCSSAETLRQTPFYVIDESIYINDLVQIVKEHVRKHKVEVVFIDYLGLIKNRQRFDSKTNEISYLTRELKCLAKDSKTAVICLSQLSRASEKENRRPTKSDLRDSGQIEADADLILLLHENVQSRDGYYLSTFEVIIEKNRFGPTGILNFNFDKDIGKVTERKVSQ